MVNMVNYKVCVFSPQLIGGLIFHNCWDARLSSLVSIRGCRPSNESTACRVEAWSRRSCTIQQANNCLAMLILFSEHADVTLLCSCYFIIFHLTFGLKLLLQPSAANPSCGYSAIVVSAGTAAGAICLTPSWPSQRPL